MQCAPSERDYDNSSRFFVLFVVVVVCQHCGCGCTWFSLILYIHPSIRQLIPNYSFASPLSPTNQTILFCPFFQIGEHQRHSPQQQQNNSIALFYFYLFFFFFAIIQHSNWKIKLLKNRVDVGAVIIEIVGCYSFNNNNEKDPGETGFENPLGQTLSTCIPVFFFPFPSPYFFSAGCCVC